MNAFNFVSDLLIVMAIGTFPIGLVAIAMWIYELFVKGE